MAGGVRWRESYPVAQGASRGVSGGVKGRNAKLEIANEKFFNLSLNQEVLSNESANEEDAMFRGMRAVGVEARGGEWFGGGC